MLLLCLVRLARITTPASTWQGGDEWGTSRRSMVTENETITGAPEMFFWKVEHLGEATGLLPD
jgi:hypothetical protein